MIDKFAVFSSHAKERLLQSGITVAEGCYMLYNAEREKLPNNLRKYKEREYGDEEQFIYRWGSFIFVLRPIVDSVSRKECYLVLTVTDQRTVAKAWKGKYRQRKTTHNHV